MQNVSTSDYSGTHCNSRWENTAARNFGLHKNTRKDHQMAMAKPTKLQQKEWTMAIKRNLLTNRLKSDSASAVRTMDKIPQTRMTHTHPTERATSLGISEITGNMESIC